MEWRNSMTSIPASLTVLICTQCCIPMEASHGLTPIILTQLHLQVAVVVSWEREDEVVLFPLPSRDLLIFLLLLQGKKWIYSDIQDTPIDEREITEPHSGGILVAQDAQDRALAQPQCRPVFIWTLR